MGLGTLVLWFSYLVVAFAQSSSTAVCQQSYIWSFNSLGQSPCTVAAILEGACNGGRFTIDALPPNAHYSGPLKATATPCECNSVVYQLVSACADCQNRTYIRWSQWTVNCTDVDLADFPFNIPAGARVPDWAYIDPSQNDSYSPQLASTRALLDKPESTSTFLPTATSTSTSQPTTIIPAMSAAKKTNVGAIAGGAMGAVVAIGLFVVIGVWWLVRRRYPSRSSSTHLPPPGSIYTRENNPSYFSFPRTSNRKYYDPTIDRSTFPSPVHNAQTIRTSPPETDSPHSPHSPDALIPSPGRYAGMPEL